MFYALMVLNILLLVVLGLVALASLPGPGPLKVVSDALKPVGDALKGLAAPFAFVAFFLGLYHLVDWVITIESIRYATVQKLIFLICIFVLVGLGAVIGQDWLKGYLGDSKAGRQVEGIKTLVSPIGMILGIVSLVLAVWYILTLVLGSRMAF